MNYTLPLDHFLILDDSLAVCHDMVLILRYFILKCYYSPIIKSAYSNFLNLSILSFHYKIKTQISNSENDFELFDVELGVL